MIKVFIFSFLIVFFIKFVSANTLKVKFEEYVIFPDLTINVLQPMSLDLFENKYYEIWKIIDSCSSKLPNITVKISEYNTLADLNVKILQSEENPDKIICIKDFNSLPIWFLKIIKKTQK